MLTKIKKTTILYYLYSNHKPTEDQTADCVVMMVGRDLSVSKLKNQTLLIIRVALEVIVNKVTRNKEETSTGNRQENTFRDTTSWTAARRPKEWI